MAAAAVYAPVFAKRRYLEVAVIPIHAIEECLRHDGVVAVVQSTGAERVVDLLPIVASYDDPALVSFG